MNRTVVDSKTQVLTKLAYRTIPTDVTDRPNKRPSSSSSKSIIKRRKASATNDWLTPAEAVAVLIQPVYDPSDWSSAASAVAARDIKTDQHLPRCYRSLQEPPSFAVFSDVPALIRNAMYWLETLLIARFHRIPADVYERAVAFFDIDDTILVKSPLPDYDEVIHPDVYALYDYCVRMNVEIVFSSARPDKPKNQSETAATLKSLGLRYDRLILMPTDVLPYLVVPESATDGTVYVGSDIPPFIVDANSNAITIDRSKPIRLAPVRAFTGPGGAALTSSVGSFKGNARDAFAGRVLINVGNSLTDLFTAPDRDIDAIKAAAFGDRSAWIASGSAADGAALAVKLPNHAVVRWLDRRRSVPNILPALMPLMPVSAVSAATNVSVATNNITKPVTTTADSAVVAAS